MSLYLDILALAAAVLVLLSVAGCTSNQPYRTSLIPCDTTQTNSNCAQAILESTPEYKLGFVEFDDQGWFWSREQLKAVESMIQEETQKTNKVIMVLFVHGWKNNAAFDNDNVKLVRTSLQVLNKAEQVQSQQQGRTPRKLIGIYAGWRGLSARLEPFKELSFWSRKQTAHKVGDGAMTELLVTLERLQQSSNHGLTAGAHGTEFIIIGHSFGGAAVYSAISQMVTERFVKTVEAGHPLKPLGDQVILLNPAFEGARHYNLNDLAISISQYPEKQRPVLSIFTSEGDWATHYAFPIGRFFSTIFQNFRHDKPQRSANLDAVGWFGPYVTHHLVYDANAKVGVTGHTTLETATGRHELHDDRKMELSMRNVQTQRTKWHPNAPTPEVYSFDDCVLRPEPNFRPGDPFLVVAVDKKIMSGHNDIGNPVLVNFLREYIAFCQNPTQTAEPEPPHN